MYWEQVGNPRGQPVLFLHGGPGRRRGRDPPPLLRPRPLARRDLRPARRRPVPPAGRAARQHHAAPGRRHRGAAPLPRHRALAAVRRLLGLDAGAGLCAGASGPRGGLRAARRLPRPDGGGGVVPVRPAPRLPRCLGRLRRAPAAGRAGRPAGRLPASRLCDPDPLVHLPAARAWSLYEGSCSTLLPSPETVASFAQDRTALGLARIEAHYFAHDLFLPPGGLLGHMDRIAHIPAEIVQGRYDMVCPPDTAFDLAAAWPRARLTVVPDAGHSALEPGVRTALVSAVERLARPTEPKALQGGLQIVCAAAECAVASMLPIAATRRPTPTPSGDPDLRSIDQHRVHAMRSQRPVDLLERGVRPEPTRPRASSRLAPSQPEPPVWVPCAVASRAAVIGRPRPARRRGTARWALLSRDTAPDSARRSWPAATRGRRRSPQTRRRARG